MKPLPLENGAFFVSSSFLETIETCSRRAQYYKINQRVSATNTGGLNFGGILHSALELYNICNGIGEARPIIDQKVMSLLEKEFTSSPGDSEDHRNLNWAVEIYEHYVKKFEFDNFDYLEYSTPIVCPKCEPATIGCPYCNDTKLRSIMAEVPFAVKLFDYDVETNYLDKFPSGIKIRELFDREDGEGNAVWNTYGKIPVYFSGYIDLPIKKEDGIYVLDYKTSSVLGRGFWDGLNMSAQQKGYTWAFQETTGLEVMGHHVRAIRTTQMPLSAREGKANKRTGEIVSQEKWWDETFPEEEFKLREGELEEWKTNAISLVEEFLWHYGRGYFPKKTQWCSGKYGRCQYFEVCSTFPDKDRPLILNSGLFKDKEKK